MADSPKYSEVLPSLPPISSLLSPAPTEANGAENALHPLIKESTHATLLAAIGRVCEKNAFFSAALVQELFLAPARALISAAEQPRREIVSARPVIAQTVNETYQTGPKPIVISSACTGAKRKELDDVDRNVNAATSRKRGKSKHATSTHAVCLNCNDLFDYASNEEGDCVYHDGHLEETYDSDVWVDHDEDCHGVIDSDELRCEYPKKYIWECCEQSGEKRRCRTGKHRENGTREEYASLRSQGFEH